MQVFRSPQGGSWQCCCLLSIWREIRREVGPKPSCWSSRCPPGPAERPSAPDWGMVALLYYFQPAIFGLGILGKVRSPPCQRQSFPKTVCILQPIRQTPLPRANSQSTRVPFFSQNPVSHYFLLPFLSINRDSCVPRLASSSHLEISKSSKIPFGGRIPGGELWSVRPHKLGR